MDPPEAGAAPIGGAVLAGPVRRRRTGSRASLPVRSMTFPSVVLPRSRPGAGRGKVPAAELRTQMRRSETTTIPEGEPTVRLGPDRVGGPRRAGPVPPGRAPGRRRLRGGLARARPQARARRGGQGGAAHRRRGRAVAHRARGAGRRAAEPPGHRGAVRVRLRRRVHLPGVRAGRGRHPRRADARAASLSDRDVARIGQRPGRGAPARARARGDPPRRQAGERDGAGRARGRAPASPS